MKNFTSVMISLSLLFSVLFFSPDVIANGLFFSQSAMGTGFVFEKGQHPHLHLQPGVPPLELFDKENGKQLSIPKIYGSVFNRNSTCLIVDVESQPTIFTFDALKREFQKGGSLQSLFPHPLDSWQWSAQEPQSLFLLSSSDTANQLYTVDVKSGSAILLKDFAEVLPKGHAASLSKSGIDDDHFAFSWRRSESDPWQFIVIWDRGQDRTYFFDLQNKDSGMGDDQEAYLDRSGKGLVLSGDHS